MWVNITERKPKHKQTVLVFRPQVLTDDHTDKPLREAVYDVNKNKFDCYHQPTQWLDVPLPRGWNAELDKRQTERKETKMHKHD